MSESKYLKLYEQLLPDNLVANDSRAPEIIEEMKAVVSAKTNAEAAKVIEWWGWDNPQQLHAFIRRARKVWKTI